MLELIKKSMLAGIGAAVVTADKVLEATRKFVEEGKLSPTEAEKLAEDLVKSGEKELEEMNARFQASLKKVSDNLEIVRKKEFQELKARVAFLEERVRLLSPEE
jgi:polyhydroxyalkanoate synthesis regulator phasin